MAAESILVVAHRGASDSAPENTVAAIEKAVALGADAVAFEVQGSSDGEPVVFADTRLERTTNGRGRVARTSLEEIRKLDAGSWFKPDFAGAKIPTLEEAVRAVGSAVAIHVHLPSLAGGSRLEERIVAVLSDRKPSAGDVLFFQDSESARRLKAKLPGYGSGLIMGPATDGWLHLEKAKKLGLDAILPALGRADGRLVAEARAASVRTFVFFADEERDVRSVLGMRAEGVYTHRVGRTRAAIAAWMKEISSGA